MAFRVNPLYIIVTVFIFYLIAFCLLIVERFNWREINQSLFSRRAIFYMKYRLKHIYQLPRGILIDSSVCLYVYLYLTTNLGQSAVTSMLHVWRPLIRVWYNLFLVNLNDRDSIRRSPGFLGHSSMVHKVVP